MHIDQTVQYLIQVALRHEATDVHFIPRKKDYIVQIRSGGINYSIKRLPIPMMERIISYLKFSSAIDISERRAPQSGSMNYYINNNEIHLRISTLPTHLQNESIAIRLFPSNRKLPIDKTVVFPHSIQNFFQTVQLNQGLLLLSGPTGSGKSSTMHMLGEYCSISLNRRVITVEDPVEIHNENFIQVQINEKSGLTYDHALKAILRHDPDVILIGEIRDEYTAKMAIRASLTGHFVIATLHANHSVGCLSRLLDLKISLIELQQTIVMISSQRLVRAYCPFCKGICHIYCKSLATKQFAIYEQLFGQTLEQMMQTYPKEEIQFPVLKDLLRKGIALGYIDEKEFIYEIKQ